MGPLGKFEVVLGYVVDVNSQNHLMEKAHDPAFTWSPPI
jgi:hypothetical protein